MSAASGTPVDADRSNDVGIADSDDGQEDLMNPPNQCEECGKDGVLVEVIPSDKPPRMLCDYHSKHFRGTTS